MDKVVGRKYFSETVCNLDKDGYWTVHNVMGEGRLAEGAEEWEVEKLEAMSMDTSFERAYATALDSVLLDFTERTINRGFKSLFDANEHDLLEKKVGEDEPKDKSN